MINIEHLSFSYTGMPPYVLSDINLKISEGEYISVIGDNGCGKTTFMRILLGFLKPTIGDVSMDAGMVGYVPQRSDFTNTGFPITVYEVMHSYYKLLKGRDKFERKSLSNYLLKPIHFLNRSSKSERHGDKFERKSLSNYLLKPIHFLNRSSKSERHGDKDAIDRALKLTGMEKTKALLMDNLSGGQKQKILIARALMGNPRLLILDEPSTGVDIESQKEIYGLLKNMCDSRKITILAVEHNLEAVFQNSTKIFHLKNGHGHLCSPDQYTAEYLPYKRRD